MQRRQFLISIFAAALPTTIIFDSALGKAQENSFPLGKTREEWLALLGDTSFSVLFEEATERAFSSPLNGEARDGTFICKACKFSS